MGRLLTIALLLISAKLFASADTLLPLQPVKKIEGTYSNFYTDNLQNIYLISASSNQIKKLNNNGDSIAVFNNTPRYGKLYSLDVTNLLKILVFYKDFATIVVLDRFLAARTTIDLRRLGITQVKAVAQSYDGNIWLYDELEGKIKKIDENYNVLLQSADLRLVFNDSLNPVKMIDNNGQLYLYDDTAGWLIFDYYAAFKKQLPFTGWKDVSVSDNYLIGRDDKQLLYAMQNDIDAHIIQSSVNLSDVQKIEWQAGKLYVLTSNGVTLYRAIQ